jgi:hypothetical protein
MLQIYLMPMCPQSVSSEPGLLNVQSPQRVSVIKLDVFLGINSMFFSYVDGCAFAWDIVDFENVWPHTVLDLPENAACPRQ